MGLELCNVFFFVFFLFPHRIKVYAAVVRGAPCPALSLYRHLASMSSDPPPPYPGGPSAPLIEEKNGQPGNNAKRAGL